MFGYKEELERSMNWLGNKQDTIFIGQAVKYKGTAMFDTLINVPLEKKIEYFVSENNQLGVSIGMSLNGSRVISIFPRWNFLACAFDQLYNHLDKIKDFSCGNFMPSLIIRTSIGSQYPIYPQYQHVGDLSEPFSKIFKNIEIIRLDSTEMIFESYKKSYERNDGRSTILVEWGDGYHLEWNPNVRS